MINSILVAIIIFYVYFYPKIKAAKGHDRRKHVENNPGIEPGDGETCKKNRDEIVQIKEKVGNVEKNIREIKRNNRDDHKSIFEKIDKIKNNRR